MPVGIYHNRISLTGYVTTEVAEKFYKIHEKMNTTSIANISKSKIVTLAIEEYVNRNDIDDEEFIEEVA